MSKCHWPEEGRPWVFHNVGNIETFMQKQNLHDHKIRQTSQSLVH